MWGESLRTWLRNHSGATQTTLGVSPEDAEELRRAGFEVASQYAISSPEMIVAAVARLLRRQVPAAALRGEALTPGVGELLFADGTVITVRGEQAGDLGRLAIRLMRARLTLVAAEASLAGVTLTFRWDDRQLRLRAIGVSQPR